MITLKPNADERARNATSPSIWNSYGTRVALFTVGLVVTVLVILGAILTAGSLKALGETMRQSGISSTLMLAEVLEQESEIGERILKHEGRFRRGPRANEQGPNANGDDPGPVSRRQEPPDSARGPRRPPPFLIEDLREIADIIGATRIAILEEKGTAISVSPDESMEEPLDQARAEELWKRISAAPEDDAITERDGGIVRVVALFTPAWQSGPRALVVEYSMATGRQIVVPLVLSIIIVTLVTAAGAACIAIWMSRTMSRPLFELASVARRYGDGDLSARAPERGPTETIQLGQAFNTMAESLDQYMDQLQAETARREQIEGELRIAALLQQELLPTHGKITIGPLEVIGSCEPAREVGGDFYDVWPVGDGCVAIAIGDATGKGLTAALLATKCLGTLRALVGPETDPADTLDHANRLLCRDFGGSGLFVTAILLLVDTRRGVVSYSLAGHNPALLLRKGMSKPDALESQMGFPLGITTETNFEAQSLDLRIGDRLLLYTDGVTEVFDAERNCYGMTRLAEAFTRNAKFSPEGSMARIKEEVRAFGHEQSSADDSTLLLLSLTPNEAKVALAV